MKIQGYNIQPAETVNQSVAKKILKHNLDLRKTHYFDYNKTKTKITIYQRNNTHSHTIAYELKDMNFNQFYNLASYIEILNIKEYTPPSYTINYDYKNITINQPLTKQKNNKNKESILDTLCLSIIIILITLFIIGLQI